MKKELPHFTVGTSYGGNQKWFAGVSMRLGGCAAQTACECCIYLDLYRGTGLYPFDIHRLSREDYRRFGNVMKPYLHPRFHGIDKTQIYLDGFGRYLKERGSALTLSAVEGTQSAAQAKQLLRRQIDGGVPVPFLCLKHHNARFGEYEWHWFLLNGYEETENSFLVRAVTYGAWEWLDFDALWNSGCRQRGGMILIHT